MKADFNEENFPKFNFNFRPLEKLQFLADW
jgi:hypothetical protein